jgi:flagellar P-ring protein precursor FlgI
MKLTALLVMTTCALPAAVRVKEVAAIEGVRDNQLVGYGLVVGLNGTGDKRQTMFSAQTLANVLDRMGVQVSPSAILVRNTAAVMMTATLPPFGQPGLRLDVQVAAIGDATNLQGGLLVLTPLRAADGQVYAVAQGAVVTGGFVAGRGGNSATLNHPTAGRVPNGATIERAAPSVTPAGTLRLQLRQADFTTASRLAAVINKRFALPLARCESAGLVAVQVPAEFAARSVDFIAEVEALSLETDRPYRIIVNERTGTVVAGREIRIQPVAVLHGALSVEVRTSYAVSQPAPLSEGKTALTPQTDTRVSEEKARSIELKPGATVDDLVRALNAIGSTPRDVIAILQALKAAGALDAELEVI